MRRVHEGRRGSSVRRHYSRADGAGTIGDDGCACVNSVEPEAAE